MAVKPGRFLNLRWNIDLQNPVRPSLASFGAAGSHRTRGHTPPATYAQWLRLAKSLLTDTARTEYVYGPGHVDKSTLQTCSLDFDGLAVRHLCPRHLGGGKRRSLLPQKTTEQAE
ncbi:MAG: hypothetical protein KA354_21585 [Phycisphaerae bacterium]|nr:hypothetical protein [Phycisphaerae bacterium]